MSRELKPPGFFAHLLILWRMRLWAAANADRGLRLPPALIHLPALIPGMVLAAATFSLMVHPVVAGDPVISRFFLGLICFVAGLVWCAWPILSAGVDDHSELSRYVAFPISRFRLLVASTLSSLLEPIAFIVYAPVVGALVGYSRANPLEWPFLAVALFAAFVCMCAIWSRVGLHLVLGVLRSNRSAEALGGFLLVLIVAGLVLPPVDTSWLYEEAGGLGAIDADVLANAAIAFGRVPPGYLAEGLRHLGEGRPLIAIFELGGLLFFTAIGLVLANGLLAGASKHIDSTSRRSSANRNRRASFRKVPGRFGVLVIREALDLWRNPRARLLVGVPFILAVLLRLLSGRDLFEHFLGPSVDAWLMGGMALYGAILVLSTFSQNSFAYDGHGFRLLMVSPVRPALVLRSKNFVHAVAAILLGGMICLFYSLYLGRSDLLVLLTVVGSLLGIVPVGLAAGNFLSIWFPVKFHASLQRRDRPPLVSAVLGIAALGAGACVLPLSMSFASENGPALASVVVAMGAAVVGWTLYVVSLPAALAELQAKRERVLSAVTRA